MVVCYKLESFCLFACLWSFLFFEGKVEVVRVWIEFSVMMVFEIFFYRLFC